MVEKSATLAETVVEFIASLPTELRQTQQQELSKFTRWFGSDRKIDELTSQTIETYQQQVESSGADIARRMEPLKSFLIYAQRNELVAGNLAKVIKFKKVNVKRDARIQTRAVDEEGVQLTREGYEQLKAELDYLINEVRPLVAHELAEARIDKDFRENAPYDAAKQHQAHVEARIRELERIIGSAEIIAPISSGERISLGTKVVIRDLMFDEEFTYTLVSTNEADPRSGRISVASPVGKALLDRLPGDVVEVAAPAGVIQYRIEKIEG